MEAGNRKPHQKNRQAYADMMIRLSPSACRRDLARRVRCEVRFFRAHGWSLALVRKQLVFYQMAGLITLAQSICITMYLDREGLALKPKGHESLRATRRDYQYCKVNNVIILRAFALKQAKV